jgi:hypothetical protein
VEPHLPPRVAALRQKLAQKAKQEPKFRFYSLYGGVMDPDTLWAAWNKVRSNGGAPGVDGRSIKQIEQKELGELELLEEIKQQRRTKTDRPQPVKRVYIPKANGKMRVVDRSVLNLIPMGLEAPVVEPPEKPGDKPRIKRNDKGTPQGGVISPLPANIYLHWFDKVLHAANGPAHWAKARLVRYADDFVVRARYQSQRLREHIEDKLEKWLGLEINRDKTRGLNVKEEGLDFLGYSFCYVNSRLYPGTQVLSMRPSGKAVQRQKDALRERTGPRPRTVPVTELMGSINRQRRGWGNYFGRGYGKDAFHEINGYVQTRLKTHLRHRSQRPFRVPQGQTHYHHLQTLGLVQLRGNVSA